ncbi:hypothetical protein D3C71_19600 [compost metagenome]
MGLNLIKKLWKNSMFTTEDGHLHFFGLMLLWLLGTGFLLAGTLGFGAGKWLAASVVTVFILAVFTLMFFAWRNTPDKP